MKKSLRILALIFTVVLISLLGVVSVWAGPAEQGSVPHPKVPPHPPSSPRPPYVINGGLYRLPLAEIPPARPGSPGLTNVDGALVSVHGESAATICFAHPRWPGFNYQIRFWDTSGSEGEGYFDPLGSWVGLPTTFSKGYYCATAVYPGIYALQGITHFPWATVK